MSNACLFIRDDDVWLLDRSFRFFFDQMIGRNLPVIYAVVPGEKDAFGIRGLFYFGICPTVSRL